MKEHVAPQTIQPEMNVDKRVEQFVKLRDKIKEIKERHKSELKEYTETLEQLSSALLDHLNKQGADNVGTSHGTVYKTSKKSASIADMSAFWTYVVSQGDFDMVDKKANPTAVAEYIEKNKSPPPGVNFSVMETIGVRRA
jgi:hypothetical protein